MPSLKQQGALSAGIQMLGQIVIALLGIATARYLGAAGFGIFAICFSLMRLSMIVSEFGMPVLAVREYVRFSARDDLASAKGLLLFSTVVVLIISICIGLVGRGVLMITALQVEEGVRSAIIAALLLLPITVALRLYSATLRGLGRVIYGQLFELFLAPLMILLIVVCMTQVRGMGRPEEVLLYYSIAYLIAIGLCVLMILRTLPMGFGGISASFHGAEWLRGGWHFVLAGGAMMLNTQVDILILGFFVSSEQIGYYRATTQTAFLSSFIVQVMYTVSSPRFAGLYERGDYGGLWSVYRLARNAGAAGVAIALIISFIFGRQILEFAFGEGFGTGWFALVVLCAGMLISALLGPNEALLSMTGREKRLSRITMLGAVINIFLNLCFIPYAGILGAAAATAISAVAIKSFLRKDVRRLIPNG